MLALAEHPLVDCYDLSALRMIGRGAAPLGADLQDACASRLGSAVGQGYDLTYCPFVALTPPDAIRPGSIGVLLPNTQARVVDPLTGADVPRGATGELWVRSPQVMRGYLHHPEATERMLDPDGWLHTGDLGHADADGYLYAADRLKELIKYKGFQVASAELEAVLLTHPDIADAAVIGHPDPEAGEVPQGLRDRALSPYRRAGDGLRGRACRAPQDAQRDPLIQTTPNAVAERRPSQPPKPRDDRSKIRCSFTDAAHGMAPDLA